MTGKRGLTALRNVQRRAEAIQPDDQIFAKSRPCCYFGYVKAAILISYEYDAFGKEILPSLKKPSNNYAGYSVENDYGPDGNWDSEHR